MCYYVNGYMFPYIDPRARKPLTRRTITRRFGALSLKRFRGSSSRSRSFYKPQLHQIELRTKYYHAKGRIPWMH